ncbi:GNAT family N-acetyltransferase [Staphylococcus auricularis]|uniref:GNAT family N-acetyltransferase n=1 Tax=Staphylococcus auricularis TaxID=29379 RepID=UPI002432E69A|nr:GNAT family N-acetyltransferase [Staphylococcus auricularis]
MEIRELTYSDVEEYYIYIKEWIKYDEKIVPQSSNIEHKNFYDYVDFLYNEKFNSEWVENITLFCFENNEILGAINIRYHLNKELLNVGGHIGYGVKKTKRGMGVATKLLSKGLEILKLRGCNYALLTCDSTNISSQKVINEFNHQKLSNFKNPDGGITFRYKILL